MNLTEEQKATFYKLGSIFYHKLKNEYYLLCVTGFTCNGNVIEVNLICMNDGVRYNSSVEVGNNLAGMIRLSVLYMLEEKFSEKFSYVGMFKESFIRSSLLTSAEMKG
jgi:hypothetical protein